MKKLLLFLFIFLLLNHVIAQVPQVFFQEDFNYIDFSEFLEKNPHNSNTPKRWTHFHSENVDLNQNGFIDEFEKIKTTSIKSDFGNGDHKSMKFELNRIDNAIVASAYNPTNDENWIPIGEFYNNITRNEIATWDWPWQGGTDFMPDEEYWFAFDIFIPNNDDDFIFESINCDNQELLNYEVVGQWHITTNDYSGFKKPPLSLQIHCNHWVISQNPISDNESGVVNNFLLSEDATVEKGKWVNWRFNVVFSTHSSGKLKVWKDGKLVVSKENEQTLPDVGNINYPNGVPVYFKIGIYKAHWWSRNTSVSKRVVYYDNVWIYKTISIIDEDCYKDLTVDDMTLTTKTVPPEHTSNPIYHFRIDSNATLYSDATSNHIHTTNKTINLIEYGWLNPNRHYFVKVMIDNDPRYYYYPEVPCEFNTPDKIGIQILDCNKELSDYDMTITCEEIPGNHVYHFRFDYKKGNINKQKDLYSNSPTINLAQESWFEPNIEYKVKVKIDNHQMFNEFLIESCSIIWRKSFKPKEIELYNL